MIPFDPSVIERYADQLYRKADSVRIGSVITGAAFGAVVGAVPVSPFGAYWPIPATFGMATILLGIILGGFIGFAIGEGRAFRIRLQAQMVLFQLQLGRNAAEATHAPNAAPAFAPASVTVTPAPAPAPASVLAIHEPVALPAPVAAPAPLLPVQPAAAVAPPPAVAVPAAPALPPPLVSPRPQLEAVAPLEHVSLPEPPARQVDELAPPLSPPLSPSVTSGA